MTNSVGILTFHGAYNYGAVLQAFALQRSIVGLGSSCSVINYREPIWNGGHHLFHLPRKRSYVKYNILILLNLRAHLVSRKRYERFRLDNLSLTTQSYKSMDEIVRGNLSFDAYVAGSDQIWHPLLLDRPCGPIYFLDFVTSGRRIAYAPSFGLSSVPSQYRDRTARFIKRFDYLSAREDTGCEIIKELTSRTPEHVLDPTLLLSSAEYDTVAKKPSLDKPYILLYPMQSSDHTNRIAIRVRKHFGWPIVAVLPSHHNPLKLEFADEVVFDAGPSEFLGWMKNAAFVCTNSFHGTCFSIIYRKQFLVSSQVNTGTRIHSLLKSVGLLSRQVNEPETLMSDDSLFEPIDYSSVVLCVQEKVSQSLDYLRRALS